MNCGKIVSSAAETESAPPSSVDRCSSSSQSRRQERRRWGAARATLSTTRRVPIANTTNSTCPSYVNTCSKRAIHWKRSSIDWGLMGGQSIYFITLLLETTTNTSRGHSCHQINPLTHPLSFSPAQGTHVTRTWTWGYTKNKRRDGTWSSSMSSQWRLSRPDVDAGDTFSLRKS